MNNEILEIAKYLKNKITAGEGVDEYNWQEIIDVCNEIERISNLKPVGYTNNDELNYRKKEETNGLFYSTIDNECCPIPLYRLDK